MKYRLLKTDIPVYNEREDQIVRYLTGEDLDGNLYEDLIHGNVERIKIGADNRLAYCTLGKGYDFLVVDSGKPVRKGFQGTFSPSEEELQSAKGDWERIAVWYAIGIASRRVRKGVYEVFFSNARWKVVSSEEESDRSVTVQVGEESQTFYFRRIWRKRARKGVAEMI